MKVLVDVGYGGPGYSNSYSISKNIEIHLDDGELFITLQWRDGAKAISHASAHFTPHGGLQLGSIDNRVIVEVEIVAWTKLPNKAAAPVLVRD